MQINFNAPPQKPLVGKVVHLAIPLRWSLVAQTGRAFHETACTYDIYPQGARLLSARPVNPGDMLLVERGRNKAVCRVIWAADPASPLRGQFTVRCVEDGRAPWEDELRQLEQQYQPLIVDQPQRRTAQRRVERPDANRRRGPRFYVEGQAEVIDGTQRVEGEIQQISEYGARIAATGLNPGADFSLMLNVFDVSLALKAQVKYLVDNLGMGVEFHEIRRGDRPLLSYVLSRLRTRRVEESAQVDLVTDPLVAVAG